MDTSLFGLSLRGWINFLFYHRLSLLNCSLWSCDSHFPVHFLPFQMFRHERYSTHCSVITLLAFYLSVVPDMKSPRSDILIRAPVIWVISMMFLPPRPRTKPICSSDTPIVTVLPASSWNVYQKQSLRNDQTNEIISECIYMNRVEHILCKIIHHTSIYIHKQGGIWCKETNLLVVLIPPSRTVVCVVSRIVSRCCNRRKHIRIWMTMKTRVRKT